jgi:hypothetical protein
MFLERVKARRVVVKVTRNFFMTTLMFLLVYISGSPDGYYDNGLPGSDSV